MRSASRVVLGFLLCSVVVAMMPGVALGLSLDSAPALAEEECEECIQYTYGFWTYRHYFSISHPQTGYTCGPNGCHTDVQDDKCRDHDHEQCIKEGETPDSIASLLMSAYKGSVREDMNQLRSILTPYGYTVELNADRGALQVRSGAGCSARRVLLHVPMTPGGSQ